jgi:hypothetical protein
MQEVNIFVPETTSSFCGSSFYNFHGILNLRKEIPKAKFNYFHDSQG